MGIKKRLEFIQTFFTTAVAKILQGRNCEEQDAFVRFRGEFSFSPNFAAPRKGNRKGKGESEIKLLLDRETLTFAKTETAL